MIADVDVHGTLEGYAQGCRGRAGCVPDPWTCTEVAIKYRGDLSFKRALDAGQTPAQVAADELHAKRSARAKRIAANRQPIVREPVGPIGPDDDRHGERRGYLAGCTRVEACPRFADGKTTCTEAARAYHQARRDDARAERSRAGRKTAA